MRSSSRRRRAVARSVVAAIAAAAALPVAAQAQAAAPTADPAPAAATTAPEAGRLPTAQPVPARAATVRRPLRRIVLPRSAVQLAAMHRDRAGRPARPGAHRKAARYRMPPSDVQLLLRTAWRAFGYRGEALELRVARNFRQIRRESSRRPAVLQGYIGDVNDRKPAGGLLQFILPTFRYWQVGDRGDRFNPLDNILAAVNAQAHGGNRILDGRSGWSPKRRHNPLRGPGAVQVIPG